MAPIGTGLRARMISRFERSTILCHTSINPAKHIDRQYRGESVYTPEILLSSEETSADTLDRRRYALDRTTILWPMLRVTCFGLAVTSNTILDRPPHHQHGR